MKAKTRYKKPCRKPGGTYVVAKILILSTLFLATEAFSQATIETSLDGDSQILDYIAKHFSGSYHGELYGVRRNALSEDKAEKEIKDFRIMHNPTLIYKPIENWQLLSSAEFKFSDQEAAVSGAGYPNGFYRALFTLTRKNILTEADHGVKLDLGIGRRQFATGSAQGLEGERTLTSYGNNRVFATVSKNIGNTSLSLFSQYLHNDIKKTTKSQWKHSAEFIPSVNVQITDKLSYFWNDDIILNTAKMDNTDSSTSITHEMNVGYVTYQWNDKISTYYQLKYYHNEGFARGFQSKEDLFEHYTGLTYAFTAKNSVTFEVGSELAAARDGRDVFSKKVGLPELALYVDLAI